MRTVRAIDPESPLHDLTPAVPVAHAHHDKVVVAVGLHSGNDEKIGFKGQLDKMLFTVTDVGADHVSVGCSSRAGG